MDDTGIPSSVAPDDDDDIDMVDTDGVPSVEQASKKGDVKLDELFADVDSDDEFPSSAPVKPEPRSSSPAGPASPM
jgi:DNA primase small subunit